MTRQQMLDRLQQLEGMRRDRITQASVDREEDVPDDAEGRAISAEWNDLVTALNETVS